MPCERLRLRAARPGDLPMLELWARDGESSAPPFIAVTLAAFEREPGRGRLLIVEDGDREAGYVVVSRLWSNRMRGEVAVIDEVRVEGVDAELVLHEAARSAAGADVAAVLVRDASGALRSR